MPGHRRPAFGDAEVNRILAASENLEHGDPNRREFARARAAGICFVMLYSGMRISDTVQLKRAVVDLKTGAPLYVRLGPPAIEALRAPPGQGEYFFWIRASKISIAIGNTRKTISRVLAVAGIEAHPHRFRGTFSVSPLSKGTDLHTIQLLLGHTSIKTTEKHNARDVESFQRVFDAATIKLNFGTPVWYTKKNSR